MHCGPARPTLFPYTTLFRSSTPRAGGGLSAHLFRSRSFAIATHDCSFPVGECGRCWCDRSAVRRSELFGRRREQTTDRKSTRLNSSHVESSYAVFCLKKKIQ